MKVYVHVFVVESIWDLFRCYVKSYCNNGVEMI